MMQKAGFALLLAASVLVSLELTRQHRRKAEHLEALCHLVHYIRGNIDFFMTPVGGILSSYRDDVLEDCGFGEAMRQGGLIAAAEEGHLCLSADAREIFLEFARGLGTSYRDEEVKKCVYFGERLSEVLFSEKEKLQKNKNLYRFVPTLCALSVILVLL